MSTMPLKSIEKAKRKIELISKRKHYIIEDTNDVEINNVYYISPVVALDAFNNKAKEIQEK
jgi:hypothetical protein